MKKVFIAIIIVFVTEIMMGQNPMNDPLANYELEVDTISSVNTQASEMSPFFIDDKLCFSSVREDYMGKNRLYRKNKAFYDIYDVDLDDEGLIKGTRVLLPGFGEEIHEGPASYCKATQELFVSISNVVTPDELRRPIPIDNMLMKLVIMKYNGSEWEITEELPFNDNKHNYSHPAISSDGNTLVFASNMEGHDAQGRMDLYMSVRKGGTWSAPVNLGANINTEGDDVFPVFINDNILTFSSDGRDEKQGGLDIYYTAFPQMEDVFNMGENINSANDDFGLVFYDNEKVGYFSSNREGAESDDLYLVTLDKQYLRFLLVIDAKSKEPIAEAQLYHNNTVYKNSDAKGKVLLEKQLEGDLLVTKEGYINSKLVLEDAPQAMVNGVGFDTVLLYQLEKTYVLENINYDYDKWNISAESELELNKIISIMEENSDMNIELGSHTDCRGSALYNMELSQKRSDSVVKYLVENGISRDRITAKAYGETQLINKCADGVDCTEAEHRVNRRTEFEFVE